MSKLRGFTLIELLVVVAIIAILSAIGITAFGSISVNARDAKRKADVESITKALENKFNPETGKYPVDLQAGYFTANALPQKPETGNYEDITWTDSDHTGFQVCVTLEKESTKYCKQSSQGKFVAAATPTPSPVTPIPAPILPPTSQASPCPAFNNQASQVCAVIAQSGSAPLPPVEQPLYAKCSDIRISIGTGPISCETAGGNTALGTINGYYNSYSGGSIQSGYYALRPDFYSPLYTIIIRP